jgi:hypothetical protein
LLVPDTSPEIDDLLTMVIDGAGATQLAASSEILDKRLVYRFKGWTDVALYRV